MLNLLNEEMGDRNIPETGDKQVKTKLDEHI